MRNLFKRIGLWMAGFERQSPEARYAIQNWLYNIEQRIGRTEQRLKALEDADRKGGKVG